MKKEILFGAIGLVVGVLGTLAIPRATPVPMDHGNMPMPGMAMGNEPMAQAHNHPMLEVDISNPTPSIKIEALPDSKDGYNIHLMTQNFLFTPEKVGGAPVSNEGHAHLYVNGKKIARVYGAWFQVGSDVLSPGANVIEVTLNANDHSDWAADGAHLSAKVTVTKK